MTLFDLSAHCLSGFTSNQVFKKLNKNLTRCFTIYIGFTFKEANCLTQKLRRCCRNKCSLFKTFDLHSIYFQEPCRYLIPNWLFWLWTQAGLWVVHACYLLMCYMVVHFYRSYLEVLMTYLYNMQFCTNMLWLHAFLHKLFAMYVSVNIAIASSFFHHFSVLPFFYKHLFMFASSTYNLKQSKVC